MKKIIKLFVLTILLSAIAIPLTFAEKPDWAGNKNVDKPAFKKDRNRYQSEKKAAIEDFKLWPPLSPKGKRCYGLRLSVPSAV